MPKGVYERKSNDPTTSVPVVEDDGAEEIKIDVKKVPAKCEWCKTIVQNVMPVFCSPECQDAYIARH